MENLRADFAQRTAGANQGRTPVLWGGITFNQHKIDAFDEAIVSAYKMTTADIARVFRVPLPVIGELGGATFNNTETLIRHWLSTGLGFILEHLELALDSLFSLPAGQFIAFDVETLLRADLQARMDALTKAVQGGIYAPNEARAKEGMPRKTHGDEPRLQQQVVPLSAWYTQPATPSIAPPAPVATPAEDAVDDTENPVDAAPAEPSKASLDAFLSRALGPAMLELSADVE
jgi:phage portal protein BeeE